jgi:transcriptional regulator with XRE-family HTH domain
MAERIGKFSTRVQQIMDDKNITMKELAEATEMTYEHTRKIVKGLVYPSKNMARLVAGALKVSGKELEDLALEDKLMGKFSHVASKMAGRNPELESIDAVWSLFDDRDKQDIYAFVKMKADMKKADRKRKVR